MRRVLLTRSKNGRPGVKFNTSLFTNTIYDTLVSWLGDWPDHRVTHHHGSYHVEHHDSDYFQLRGLTLDGPHGLRRDRQILADIQGIGRVNWPADSFRRRTSGKGQMLEGRGGRQEASGLPTWYVNNKLVELCLSLT